MFLSDLKSQLAETSETVGEFHWSSLHPADAFREGEKARGGDQRNRTESGQILRRRKNTHTGMLALCVHTLSYIWMYTLPTLHVVWSADLMRTRKRPVLGGNSGLVSVVQCHRKQTEAVLKCASAARLGQAQQKTQGIKINLRQRGRVSAETGNIPLRERRLVRGKTLGWQMFFCFYDPCIVSLVACSEEVLYYCRHGLSNRTGECIQIL